MTATEEMEKGEQGLVDIGVADDIIAGMRGRLIDLEADTPSGYESVRAGLAELRTLRNNVERSRKQLKESALDWGRKVDKEAKRVKGLIVEIEEPLKAKKFAIDDAKAEEKRKQEEAARLEEQAIARAEQEKRQAAERKEQERLEAEREKERQEQNELRAELEAENKRLEEDRKKLQAERDKLEAEKQKQEQVEQDRRAEVDRKERESRLAAELAEREKVEAKQTEEALVEAARLAEERKPDRQKLIEWFCRLREVPLPEVTTDWGTKVVSLVSTRMNALDALADIKQPD